MVMKALHTASLVSTVMTLLLLLGSYLVAPGWSLPLWEKALIFLVLSYAGSFLIALFLAKKEQQRKQQDKKDSD
jgi:membrane protein implicated in regulation of membrane protease activity